MRNGCVLAQRRCTQDSPAADRPAGNVVVPELSFGAAAEAQLLYLVLPSVRAVEIIGLDAVEPDVNFMGIHVEVCLEA